jgi:hypothetical protein
MPADRYAIASLSRLPNPPTNGFIDGGNADFRSRIMFDFILLVCFNSYFLNAARNY